MKRLILLRHAKAEAKDAARDIERVLAPRGRADMAAVGPHLAQSDLRPDLALVSVAERTRETWALAGLAGVPVVFEPRIYEASPDMLLRVIRERGGAAARLLVVGHNPGLEDLAAILVEGRASWGSSISFPTGTVAAIDAEIESWEALGPSSGRLASRVTPADLGAGKDAARD